MGEKISSYIAVLWIILFLPIVSVLGAGPVFEGLPCDLNVGENDDTDRLVYNLTVSHPTQDPFTCAMTLEATPAGVVGNEFTFLRNLKTSIYELDVGPGTFDTTKTYTTVFKCNDGAQTTTGQCTVHIMAGDRIYWDNVPAIVPVSAPTITEGDEVFTIRARTALNKNSMEYFLTSVDPTLPDPDQFFQLDKSTGKITARKGFINIDDAYPTIDLYVRGTDETLSITGKVTIQLSNQKTRPETSGVPAGKTVSESTAPGTVLFEVDPDDPDNGETYTHSWTSDPLADDMFELDPINGVFKLKDDAKLNYEGVRSYNITFFTNDGTFTSFGDSVILTVADANEAPSFTETMHYVTLPEGAAGSSSVSAGLTCTDPDYTDTADKLTYRYLEFNNSDRFDINSKGEVSFAKDYDLDNTNYPAQVILTVCCVDDEQDAPLSGCTQITVTITDVNDNTPEFPTTCRFFSDQTMQAGSAIGTITPTDADIGTNGEIKSCTASSEDGYSSYYNIDTCAITLAKKPDFEYGQTVKYVVEAVDNGSPSLTGTKTCEIIYREVTTTTVTTTTAATTTAFNIWERPEFIALFVLSLLAGLALLGLSLALCLRCCCAGGGNFCDCAGNTCCERRPPRQVTPVTPPKEKTVYRERSPPPRIIEQRPQRIGVIRTIARPTMGYGQLRPMPTGGFLRTAPNFIPPPAYYP